MKKKSANQKEVMISSKKTNGRIVTERKILNSRRRVEDVPIIDEEWEKFFDDHQYGFGADMLRCHGMDLATAERPMGPWYERLP
jgi:hypothetical protein